MQHSFEEPFAKMSNMSLTFDTNQNTYTVRSWCGSRTCTIDQVCVQNMCVQSGSLSILARWSRGNGQGHLVIRTPLNNTIYFGNPRPNSSGDDGRHEQVGDGSEVDHIYWPSNSTPPQGFYKICFSTGSLLNDSDASPVTVTIEVRRSQHEMETETSTFNTSTTDFGECSDTSDTFIASYSTGMCRCLDNRSDSCCIYTMD